MSGGEVLRIRGGAGPYEAAAVIAVVMRLLEEEAVARSTPPARPIPPAWVRLGVPQPVTRFTPPVRPEPGMNRPG